MKTLKLLAGISGITSGILFATSNIILAGYFGANAIILMAAWMWYHRFDKRKP